VGAGPAFVGVRALSASARGEEVWRSNRLQPNRAEGVARGAGGSSMSGFLESLHLYRKVPRDLTDATRVGGALSLACAALMAYLFVSNFSEYMTMQTTTDVALDDSAETSMRIYFNITMERLPCQFASVDVSDVMGTSVTNVTQHIVKFKVAPGGGHRKAEFYPETEDSEIITEELEPHELAQQEAVPSELPTLNDEQVEAFIKHNDLVLIAFGAPWCPWSQRLDPVWRKTWDVVKSKPYAQWVRVGKVDCTAADAQATCQKHHIHAFPTIRIYRHRQSHSHENYLGDRTSDAFISFIEEALPRHLQGIVHPAALPTPTPTEDKKGSNAAESHSLNGEGCQLTGSLQISRVPGNFRISAQSDSHSFNTRVMNVSHHVDKLMFGYTNEHAGKLHKVVKIEERSSLYQVSFMMHQELATLKHYLKVVPFHYHDLSGNVMQTYMYKANYNEYRPRKLEWYEGKADAHVDTQMIPNAVFYYDISPVKVLVQEETQGFASFVTKICAVIGGIYTVVGLLDNVIYHSGQSIKKLA